MSQIPEKKKKIKQSFSHGQTSFKTSKQNKYQKVIGNTFEGQGYADKRKRKVVNQYRRDRKKLLQGSSTAPSSSGIAGKSSSQEVTDRSKTKRQAQDRFVGRDTQSRKFQSGQGHKHNRGQNFKTQKNRFWQAEQEHKQKKAEKQKNKEDYQERQEKQAAALKVYKEKKFARHKKLSKRTQRGQPVMKYQIEHLLEKLKNEQD